MKSLSVITILVSLLILGGCEDTGSQIITKVKQKTSEYSKALKAAKDVERQLLEVDLERRKKVEEMAVPGS
jgi:hypothetical protein